MEKNSANREPLSSVVSSDTTNSNALTLSYIDELANGLNSKIENIIVANAIILRNVLADGLFGRTYESIVSNINTEYKLTYHSAADGNAKELADVKSLISSFNRDIDLRSVIRDAISGTYLEGNYPLYLRMDKSGSATIDHYPLNICACSDYRSGRDSILEFNITSMKSRLQKTYRKTKKNKAVYFENIDKEIHANYPKEIYDGYKANENYVRLNPKYSGCVKVNDMGRKHGVSPLFKCLRPLIVLNNVETADVSDSKARSKKIIFQKLRKELGGTDGTRKGLAEVEHSHAQAAQALNTNNCLYTAAWWVENLEYVTSKSTSEDTAATHDRYTSDLITALGIGFADPNVATSSSAKISVEQLLKTINSISESLERIIEKFYRALLADNGHDPWLAPSIQIIDSEQLAFDLKKSLAELLYSKLNCSLETALTVLGFDVKDEETKRIAENKAGYDGIFLPRKTSYTTGGADTVPTGRGKSSDDIKKQEQNHENYEGNK